jgi:restriction endonuclease S subunit
VKGDTLNTQSLRAIPVALPSLAQQRRIIDLVGHVDSTIARARLVSTLAIAAARATVASTIAQSVERRDLGSFANVRGGKRLPKGTPWAGVPTGHPYIRVLDLSNGRIRGDALVQVPIDVWPLIRSYVIEPGDVVISIVGTIGEIAVVPEHLAGANLTENAARIRPGRDLDARFLSAYLRGNEGQAEIAKRTVGTTQPKLALFRINAIPVPVLPIDAQRSCAALHDAFEAVAQEADYESARASHLRSELLTSLLAGDHEIPESYDRILDGAA